MSIASTEMHYTHIFYVVKKFRRIAEASEFDDQSICKPNE